MPRSSAWMTNRRAVAGYPSRSWTVALFWASTEIATKAKQSVTTVLRNLSVSMIVLLAATLKRRQHSKAALSNYHSAFSEKYSSLILSVTSPGGKELNADG